MFITIDHRRNDGAQHRRAFTDIRDLYRDILAQGCPTEFYQVLCLNCNMLKGTGAECLHQTERRERSAAA